MKKVVSFLAKLLQAASLLLYLFTIGLAHKPHRAIAREITRTSKVRLFFRPRIPTVMFTDLVPCQVSLTLHEQRVAPGNINPYELIVLAELVQSYQPRTCFEFGTFDGRTTLNIAANTPEGAIVYTLDLPCALLGQTAYALDPKDLGMVEKETSGARFHGTGYERKIHQLYGDSATFDYGPYEGQIDFVFIDGSHSYEYVLSDSRHAIRLLRDGKGVLLWHDYMDWLWPGVYRAINELQVRDPRFAHVRSIEGTTFACLICM